jgi:UDP-N-acetylglucosamine 1-carboxyvinyltransferase
MEKFVIRGGNTLTGTIAVSGAKNVVLKMLVAACLTDEEIIIHNVPIISDVTVMIDIIRELGGSVSIEDHTLRVRMKAFTKNNISLDQASHIRTSSMFLAPLLIRQKQAVIPNPGGCRIGARPIDRTVDGIEMMGATITYQSEDGYFHAEAEELHGVTYRFDKNTHTGTETLIIAAAMARGKTQLENAAEEPEIDELIALLNAMGAQIKRTDHRVIEIEGVERLHGAEVTIKPDRNEIVTFAIAAIVTHGDVFIRGAKREDLQEFLEKLEEAGGGIEEKEDGIRFFFQGELQAVNVTTSPYPGFMTDWQAPWAMLMTQAKGESIIHETVFENRFGYVKELRKMGARIKKFSPEVLHPDEVYNFELSSEENGSAHAIKITGPTALHNAVVTMTDLRAGASLVIAALAAQGETVLHGIHLVDRGYEKFEERLSSLGADIRRVTE